MPEDETNIPDNREIGRDRAIEGILRTDFGAQVNTDEILDGFREGLERKQTQDANRRRFWLNPIWIAAAAALILAAFVLFSGATPKTRAPAIAEGTGTAQDKTRETPEIDITEGPARLPEQPDVAGASVKIVQLAGRFDRMTEFGWLNAGGADKDNPLQWKKNELIRVTGTVGVMTTREGQRFFLAQDSQIRLVSLRPLTIGLAQGDVFCEVPKSPPSPGPETARFVVRTDETDVRVLGTSFGVRRSGNLTRVAVLRGSVQCTGKKGSVSLGAGTLVEVSTHYAPVAPRDHDVAKLYSWAKYLY